MPGIVWGIKDIKVINYRTAAFEASCRGVFTKCGKVGLLWMPITTFLEIHGGGARVLEVSPSGPRQVLPS